MSQYDYDLFVIGGGSGGVRASRVAAALGKKVAVAEEFRFGGTCVIRGCVPKKLYVYASQFGEQFRDAAGYGWTVGDTSFDWKKLVAAKDAEIARLEGIYRRNVASSSAEVIDSRATLVDRHSVRLEKDGRVVTADQILIATGGRPSDRPALEGFEHCITSNEAFDLPELPKAIVIEGGGYIAVEFANIFHGLGVQTTLVYRGQKILSRFDADMRDALSEEMEKKGIRIACHSVSQKIVKRDDGRLDVHLNTGEVLVADQVMQAVGRKPNTDALGLEAAGVKLDEATGAIMVDEFSRSSVDNIWAIGDVTNRVQLTPVAIHEAMCLVETLYKNNPTRPDFETIATAVFSQPEIGTVGLTEDEAAQKFETVEIYRTAFRPMRNILAGRDERMVMKLVVDAGSRKVVGAHVLGPDAGEMAQLLGISVKAGLTKDDFDATMAVHPTAAEELVTLYKPTYLVRNGKRVE